METRLKKIRDHKNCIRKRELCSKGLDNLTDSLHKWPTNLSNGDLGPNGLNKPNNKTDFSKRKGSWTEFWLKRFNKVSWTQFWLKRFSTSSVEY